MQHLSLSLTKGLSGIIFISVIFLTGSCGDKSANQYNIFPDDIEFSVIRLSPFFLNDQTLFIGTEHHGLYLSRNRGKNWIPMGLSETRISDIAIAVSNQQVSEIWAATDGGIFVTNIDQANWKNVSPNMTFMGFEVELSPDYEKTGQVVAIVETIRPNLPSLTVLYVSNDRGISWTSIPGRQIIQNATYLPDGRLFGSRPGSVFITRSSLNQSPLWDRPLQSPDLITASVSPAFEDDNLIIFGSPVQRFEADSNQLTPSGIELSLEGPCGLSDGYGPSTRCFVPVAISPNFAHDSLTLAAASDALYFSNDKGLTWTRSDFDADEFGPAAAMSISHEASGSPMAFIVTKNAVLHSRDGGRTWESLWKSPADD